MLSLLPLTASVTSAAAALPLMGLATQFLLALAAAGLALFIGALTIRQAGRFNLVDVPDAFSSHVVPTPRGGGVGIVVVVMVALAWLAGHGDQDPLALPVLALAALGVLVAIVSAIDDMGSVPASVRLLVHLAVGVGAWRVVGTINEIALPWLPVVALGAAGGAVTVLWVAGLLNAYNFMDGIDGLAASQGVVAGLAWAVFGWHEHSLSLYLVGQTVAAACLGFLILNRPPARVFMGDVGSAFLGYLFAAIPLAVGGARPRLGVLGVVVVWPFVFDAGLTFVQRAWRRENVFARHRSHLYQRLVISGWSHGRVTLLYAALAAVGAAGGIRYARHLPGGDWVLVVGLPLMAALLVGLTWWREHRVRGRDHS